MLVAGRQVQRGVEPEVWSPEQRAGVRFLLRSTDIEQANCDLCCDLLAMSRVKNTAQKDPRAATYRFLVASPTSSTNGANCSKVDSSNGPGIETDRPRLETDDCHRHKITATTQSICKSCWEPPLPADCRCLRTFFFRFMWWTYLTKLWPAGWPPLAPAGIAPESWLACCRLAVALGSRTVDRGQLIDHWAAIVMHTNSNG